MTAAPYRRLTVTAARRRTPGGQVCPACRALVVNADLRQVVKPGRTRGRWVCSACSIRLTGGDPDG